MAAAAAATESAGAARALITLGVRFVLALALALPLISCAHSVSPRPPTRPNSTRVMTFSATAYCQTGKTASGELARPGMVAADPRVLPLGTWIRVNGLRGPRSGVYRVSDVGSAVKGREIDIFMASCRDAQRFGRQRVRVRVLSD